MASCCGSTIRAALVPCSGPVNRPKPNFNLLDHFLVMMEYQKVKTVICFNKEDLSTKEELEELQRIYAGCESQVLFVSAGQEKGM